MTNAFPWQAAVFDLDGTLLDSLGVWARVDAEFFARRGMEMPADYIAAISGLGFQDCAEYTRRRFDLPETADQILAEWTEMAAAEYAGNVALKPGAARYLRALKRAGVRLAVATVLPERFFAPCLKRHGLCDLFDAICTSAEVGATRRDSAINNHHVMYKLINKQLSIDSVQLSYVTIQGDTKTQNAVLQQLNAGKTLDELKKAYPQKVEGKLNEWQRAYNAHDTLKAKIVNAGNEYIVFNRNNEGAVLMKVNEKKAPKMFYTLATVTYDAYASTKTSEELRDKFQDFLNKNKTIKAFEENAAKAGYNATEMLISPSSAQIGQMKDTRKVIKWAFDNKKGDVSPIFSDNNDVLIAAAIDDIYDQEYLPYNFPQGKEMLTKRIRNSKKGDDLMKQYQGKAKDVESYAMMMGNKVDTANVVFFNGDPKIEPMIVGRISAAKPGVMQGPFKGEDAVYVYKVVKQEKVERQPTKEELERTYAQRRGVQVMGNPTFINKLLAGSTKVKKNIIKFF